MNIAYVTAVASTFFLLMVMVITERSVQVAKFDQENEEELLDQWMILLNLSLLIWNLSLSIQTIIIDFLYHKIVQMVKEKRKIEEEFYGADFDHVSYNDEDKNLNSLSQILTFYGIIAVY